MKSSKSKAKEVKKSIVVIRPEAKERLDKVYKSDGRMKNAFYEKEMEHLHVEFIRLQNWVKKEKKKVAILFEGRDGAGKGGTIKALTTHLNPRGCRIVALQKPTETEASEWYFKRYISVLPTGGEIVFFDRSWYNRAGVERVMGFCTQEQYKEFITQVDNLEQMLISSGYIIYKYFLDVSKEEQKRRIERRRTDPLRMWKLSPIDDKSLGMWDKYTETFEKMLARTHTHFAPWCVVNSNDKKRARINIARDILSKLDYEGKDPTRACLLADPSIVYQYSEFHGMNIKSPTETIKEKLKELKKSKQSDEGFLESKDSKESKSKKK